MQTVIQVIAYGGPLFLALMGVFVVDHRPETFQGRLLWYGGFIFVAFLSIWAAVKAANAGKKEVISMLMDQAIISRKFMEWCDPTANWNCGLRMQG